MPGAKTWAPQEEGRPEPPPRPRFRNIARLRALDTPEQEAA